MSLSNKKMAVLTAGAGMISALYADKPVSTQKNDDFLRQQSILSALGLHPEQNESQNELYLAGIRQAFTRGISQEFDGLTAEEIVIKANSIGLEVEWVQV